jgi:hypothetical protein
LRRAGGRLDRRLRRFAGVSVEFGPCMRGTCVIEHDVRDAAQKQSAKEAKAVIIHCGFPR